MNQNFLHLHNLQEELLELLYINSSKYLNIDDVLNEKVTVKDVKNFDIAQKTLCVNSLSQVKEGDLDEIREFVTTFGPELTTLFDKLWLHYDSSRLERLQEAQMVNRMVLSRR